MADATERTAHPGLSVGIGEAATVKSKIATVELAASSAGTVVNFFKIPSNARILPSSRLYNDDLATSGSPTLDIGLKGDQITDDPDAIGNGFAIDAAGSDVVVISDVANVGLPAWDFVNGQTSDPLGYLTVYGTVADAATTATGTVSLQLDYVLD